MERKLFIVIDPSRQDKNAVDSTHFDESSANRRMEFLNSQHSFAPFKVYPTEGYDEEYSELLSSIQELNSEIRELL